ncbi:MAG TPA: ATP-binding protein [Gaiellaceae bacterium]
MTRRLLASYLALTVVVLVALELPLAIVNARNERQDLTAKVERDAFAAASLAEDVLQTGATSPALQQTALAYRRDTGGRMVIVNRRGVSIADSHPTFPGERQFASRPEIAAALAGRTVAGTRSSNVLHTRLIYVAVPVASSGAVFGAVRITYPTSTLDHRVNRYRLVLLAVAAVVLAAAALVGLLLARSISGPLRRVQETAARVGAGELDARAPEDDGPADVRRLAAELNRTTANLAALLGSQEQFVADASHELRTPLTALRLRLETGDTRGAIAEAERLSRIVDALLALARVDASGGGATDADLAAVASARARQWAPLAAENGVDIVAEGSDAHAFASEERIAQVLDNLLANAIDASPRGGTIRVRAERNEVHVVDEGPGLSDEERARAFDRFWTKGKSRGSGLGLSIARRLAELDGGTVELRRADGGGTDAVVAYR